MGEVLRAERLPDATAPDQQPGFLYHRHDGGLLAFVPGDQRDEDFEHHLRAQGIPFKVIPNFPKRPPVMGEINGQHLAVYRRHPRVGPDGMPALHHVLHYANGTALTFAKESLSALPAPTLSGEMREEDLTVNAQQQAATALVASGGIDYDRLAAAIVKAQRRDAAPDA
jgi:hypothetical protein